MNESQEAIYPSLKNRVVFITGGASGIGAAITEKFCKQGAKVSFVDIDDASAHALIARIEARGWPPPCFQHCDLVDVAALQTSIERTIAADGRITVLVNNAASDDRHTIDQVTPEYFDDRIAINLRHHFFAVQAVHGSMAAAGGGSIVNIGSVTWLIGQGGMPCYSAAKAAVAGLTRSLARDLGAVQHPGQFGSSGLDTDPTSDREVADARRRTGAAGPAPSPSRGTNRSAAAGLATYFRRIEATGKGPGNLR